MSIILSAGTLGLIVIVVLCSVLALVSCPLLLLSRAAPVSVSHCRRCHAPVWVGGSQQPPYLETRPPPVPLTRNTVITVNYPREQRGVFSDVSDIGEGEVNKSVAVVIAKTPCHRASLLLDPDPDQPPYSFQRSCSTRKKVPQSGHGSDREEEHGSRNLFR